MRKCAPLPDRLKARLITDSQTGCHNWTGYATKQGYGQIAIGGNQGRDGPHRVAFELAKGAIPAGYQIDHLCRNPRCCNPDHLEAVTREENIRRGNAPSARAERTGACVHGHLYTPENTAIKPDGARYCRTCKREQTLSNGRRRRARLKAAK